MLPNAAAHDNVKVFREGQRIEVREKHNTSNDESEQNFDVLKLMKLFNLIFLLKDLGGRY